MVRSREGARPVREKSVEELELQSGKWMKAGGIGLSQGKTKEKCLVSTETPDYRDLDQYVKGRFKMKPKDQRDGGEFEEQFLLTLRATRMLFADGESLTVRRQQVGKSLPPL
jgi:hypothetical protein